MLKVNYRNRASVLDHALRFDATSEVDDLDGAAGVALRQAECANTGGEARSWRGPERDLHRDPQEGRFPFLPLEQYEGETDDELKVGIVHRAKGLDFQAVLSVQLTNGAQSVEPAVRERQYLVAATRARGYLWWGVAEAAGR